MTAQRTSPALPPTRSTPSMGAPLQRGARTAALVSGAAILAMAPLGIAANVIVLQAGAAADPAAFDAWLSDGEQLLRVAVLAFVGVVALDIVAAWGLAWFLGSAGSPLGRLAGWLRLAYAAVLAAATSQLATALPWSATPAASPGGIDAVRDFSVTWQIGLILFAAHLAVVAVALVRSSGLPTWLGWLVAIAALGYGLDALVRFGAGTVPLLTDALLVVVSVGSIGEVALAVWLLVRGGRAASSSGRAARGARS